MTSDPSSDIRAQSVREIACGKCSKTLDVSALPVFTKFDCPHCGTKLSVPALFGGFLLLERMGSGGMGAVYRALDQSLGRFVAIKVMKSSLGADAGLLEGFLREARTAAALNHPNIVQIYASGQVHGQPYIVMELVSGGRLDQLMESGPVPESRILSIALDVAEGLKAAGEAGLVHSDIKPGNILFDKRGTAKIADFGLAQFIHRQQAREGIWGTPYYISPECAKGQPPDHRSDLYSLGATLYHALAAEPPFDGQTPTDVVLARLKQPAPELHARHATRASPGISRVIARMLQVDPARRYPSWASLQADLREVQVGGKGPATSAVRKPGTVATKPAAPGRSSSRWIALIAGLVLLVGGTFAVMHLSKAKKAKAKARAESRSAATTAPVAKTSDLLPTALAGDVAMRLRNNFPKQVAMLRDLLDKKDKIKPGSGSALWIELICAMAELYAGSEMSYPQLLDGVANATPPAGDKAAEIAIAVSHFVQGKTPDADFQKLARDWPPWVMDYAQLMRGMDAVMRGDFETGTSLIRSYATRKASEPEWVYAPQGKIKSLYASLEAMRPELNTLKDPSLSAKDRDAKITTLQEDRARLIRTGLEALKSPASP